ncbi:hypothetical protein ATPR_2869 [Acetobacter tropicalis NBRC 101654]|uniref:Uncharacterized protein n=1 Tax=Acetobacter tropicalis NBRC 101654 TaxID=749388 RepID=F7VHM0_9PROT|nr:hypothetical protein [Acetobacter tropicalis]GAA09865.1 hypothetical protein ATPR_2869 [Acetobacter tropicalis NBRC 101654]
MNIQDTLSTALEFYTDPLLQIQFLLKIIEQYGYNTDLKQITKSQTGYDQVRFWALVLIGSVVSSISFQSSTDSESIANKLNDIYEAEYEFRTDISVCEYLTELQAETVGIILNEGYGLPQLVTYTTKITQPSCVISQVLYSDSTREQEIILRNNDRIRHPLFMPLELEVLSE